MDQEGGERRDRPYGWRGRIGVIVPSPNTVCETEFWRMAPAGVTVHTTRLWFRAGEVERPLEDMEQYLPRALAELKGARVDLVAYACTASSMHGSPDKLAADIAGEVGAPAITTAGAVLAALAALGARRIAVGTPYPAAVNEGERRFFAGRQIAVTRMASKIVCEEQHQFRGMSRVPTEAVCDLAAEIDTPDSDAIFLSCSDMATLDAIPRIEAALGKPVVTSTQATFWQALRTLGIGDRIPGAGRLFAEH
ncbi:MAG: decarboxylase [Alphaproteobacteria bacterium]|nr:decarboxylase [Alphaproteobacteria bacterium]